MHDGEIVPDWYWILDEEPPPGLVHDLPPPAAGRFVLMVDGDPSEARELGLLWELPDGRRMLAPTDGYLASGVGPGPATWLPRGWRVEYLVPIGLTRAHLECWLDAVIVNVECWGWAEKDTTYAYLVPRMTSDSRELVAAAYLIVRHLGLPDSPQEPRTAIDRAGCVAALRDVREFLREAMPGETPPDRPATAPDDGPRAGRWLWWQGKRHDVPKGVTYRLIEHMWGRDSASYDDLVGPVFEADMLSESIRSRASDANKVLGCIGIPWRLSTDSVNRYLVKRAGDRR